MNKIFFIRTKEAYRSNKWEKKFLEELSVDVRVDEVICYKVFGIEEEEVKYLVENILLDNYTKEVVELDYPAVFGYKLHDNQFCARSESVKQCFNLRFSREIEVVSGTFLCFDRALDLEIIKKNVINVVDSEEMDLSLEKKAVVTKSASLKEFTDFANFTDENLQAIAQELGLTLDLDDLRVIRTYAQNEKCSINELELRVLDTYWSDHCRHTTFNTIIDKIDIADDTVLEVYKEFLEWKKELGIEHLTLMNLATINAKYLKKHGHLLAVEESEEVNACSVHVDLDGEDWLMMFKNETHNHPTEIEPFGGAATCVGGAIRDPLSGRSYVYQAVRVSGSGNPFENISETLANKLAQKRISLESAKGYSSYGNQIGLTTTYVKELFHESYKAKHLEVGAVIGANKLENVVRMTPCTGDIVLLLGGKTGKDGIGGATGSSKELDDDSLYTQSAQVQKGNAIEERKLQRLFRKSEFSKLVKRSNDFGAGGVSVAIGEIASGVDVYLDRVPLKYQNLSPLEIALSESQERMAIVIDKGNLSMVEELCRSEAVEVVHVGDVTDTNYLRFYFEDECILKLKRDFLDSAGATRLQSVRVKKQEGLPSLLKNDVIERLAHKSYASQFNLNTYFDSSIGARTVLSPYGGQTRLTSENVSAVYFPKKHCRDASLIAYGFDTLYAEKNTFLASYYAIVEAVAKLVSSGAKMTEIHLSLQEYFEKLGSSDIKWGKPFMALLGAFKAMKDLNLAAIGGKDSMSGTYEDLNVIPTLIAFAFSRARKVISSDLKQKSSKLYLLKPKMVGEMLNLADLKAQYQRLNQDILSGKILSARSIDSSGLFANLAIMGLGNRIGFEIKTEVAYDHLIGGIIIESSKTLDYEFLGYTTSEENFICNEETVSFLEAKNAYTGLENKLYHEKVIAAEETYDYCYEARRDFLPPNLTEEVRVVIPIFPGTNSEDDVKQAFENAGGVVREIVINNMSNASLEESLKQFASLIKDSHIIALVGGFSLADEPDGSGKFIANILKTPVVAEALNEHLAKKHLVIGICNGFQALVKSGLLLKDLKATLYHNECGHHISQLVSTKIVSTNSPWLRNCDLGKVNLTPISHGEGRFILGDDTLKKLLDKGQVFSMYCDDLGIMSSNYNPNGSTYNIEGVVSEDGLILGKMGHDERMDNHLFINVKGEKQSAIFKNGIDYFRGGKL